MRRHIASSVFALLTCIAGPTVATADTDSEDSSEALDSYESTVTDFRITPAEEGTGIASTISVAEETSRLTTVSDVVSRSPGVHVRRLGGFGEYGAASIRGSTAAQVPVYMDGVALNAAGFPSVDLGSLSLDTFESLEIYRSAAPIGLGPRGLGGAIVLHPRTPDVPVSEATFSVGSHESWRLHALHQQPLKVGGFLFLAHAQGSAGDFDYLNDNGTWHNADDDVVMPRANNAHSAAGFLGRFEARSGIWKTSILNDLYFNQQGLAGLDSIPTESSQLRLLRNTAVVSTEAELNEHFTLDLQASWLAMTEEYSDPKNEVGFGYGRLSTDTHSIAGASQGRITWGPRNRTDLRLGGRYELLDQQDLLTDTDYANQYRIRGDFGLSHEWDAVPRWLLISPAIQVEVAHAIYTGGDSTPWLGTLEEKESTDAWVSPSLGLRAPLRYGFEIRTNAGRYVRIPDLLELFGDRGLTVGNPNLQAESGVNVDAGISWNYRSGSAVRQAGLGGAFFAQWADDLIVWIHTGNSLKPENIDSARITGLETEGILELSRVLKFEINYTFTDPINTSDEPIYNGNQLPGRPAHEVWARATFFHRASRWESELWLDGDYAGQNYLTPYNTDESLVARLYFGIGASLTSLRTGLTASLDVRNLLNRISAADNNGVPRPMMDYDGFPLPGRTVFLTLRWRMIR